MSYSYIALQREQSAWVKTLKEYHSGIAVGLATKPVAVSSIFTDVPYSMLRILGMYLELLLLGTQLCEV